MTHQAQASGTPASTPPSGTRPKPVPPPIPSQRPKIATAHPVSFPDIMSIPARELDMTAVEIDVDEVLTDATPPAAPAPAAPSSRAFPPIPVGQLAKELMRPEYRATLTEVLRAACSEQLLLDAADKAVVKRHGKLAVVKEELIRFKKVVVDELLKELTTKHDKSVTDYKRLVQDAKTEVIAAKEEAKAAKEAATNASALLHESIAKATEVNAKLAQVGTPEYKAMVLSLLSSVDTARVMLEQVTKRPAPAAARPAPPPAAPAAPKKDSSNVGAIIFLVLVVLLVAFGGWWVLSSRKSITSHHAAGPAPISSVGKPISSAAPATSGNRISALPAITAPAAKTDSAPAAVPPKASGTHTGPQSVSTDNPFDESKPVDATQLPEETASPSTDTPRLRNGETGICIQASEKRITKLSAGGSVYTEASGRQRICQADRLNAEQKLCGCPNL